MAELTHEEMLRIDMILHENSGKKNEKIYLLLGEDMLVKGEPGENMNMVVVGPTSCNKNSSYIMSTILAEEECSLVVDDRNGCLYEETSKLLRMKGYSVYKLDLCNFNGNIGYNIFDNASTKEDAMRIADALIPSQSTKEDCVLEMPAKELFCMLVQVGRVEYGKHFNLEKFFEVLDLCSVCSSEFDKKKDGFEKLMDSHMWQGLLYDAQEDYIKLKNSSDESWLCILKFLREELHKFRSEVLYAITSETTVPVPFVGLTKIALFVVGGDLDASVCPIIQILYHDLIDGLNKYADEREWELLPIHVRFLVEDYSGVVWQSNLEKLVADNFRRNISYIIGFQSLSKFWELCNDRCEAILGGESHVVLYGPTDDADTVCVIRRGHAPYLAKSVQTLKMPEYMLLQAIKER